MFFAGFTFAVSLITCMPVRPTVFPTLDSMPRDQTRVGEYLETTKVKRRPETKMRLPKKLQTFETTAATVAAVIAVLLSSGNDAAAGIGFSFDENNIFGKRPTEPARSDERQTDSIEQGEERFSVDLPLVPIIESDIEHRSH